jgi:LemA protein
MGPLGPDPESRGYWHKIPGSRFARPGMTKKKLRLRDRSDTLRQNSTGENSMRRLWTVLAALATLSLTNCGYNAIQSNDEQVKSSWSEVVNQYQRRADLVPNLVNSVKGFAQQEKDVLLGVTNARAKVGSIQATPEVLNDPAAFQKFQAAQGELSSALSRLLVVTENYPQLKSDALFRDLMTQLEGTENRITVARNRYIKAVQDYNVTIRSFPTNLTAMAFGYKEKPNFTVDNEKAISTAPKVDFNPAPAAPAK